MPFYSQAWQDEFVINLLGFKRNGCFIDIGSGDGINQSNSYFFESEMGWRGICVERGTHFMGWKEMHASDPSRYKARNNSLFLNDDATVIDYKKLLEENGYPNRMDYLSVDIDEGSAKVFYSIPFDQYKFSVITVEHDAYRFGDNLRSDERKILEQRGYKALFPNVLVPLGCGMGPNLPFEDWWVDPSSFDMSRLSTLGKECMYPDEIVAMLKTKNLSGIYRP
jgi:hypothetical protein